MGRVKSAKPSKSLAKLIESIRAAVVPGHLSQAEIARRAGMKPQQLNDVLSGIVCPRVDFLDRIADALGVHPSTLFMTPEERARWETPGLKPHATGVDDRLSALEVGQRRMEELLQRSPPPSQTDAAETREMTAEELMIRAQKALFDAKQESAAAESEKQGGHRTQGRKKLG